jgi:predicted site-specific integrase-resolvase
MHTTLPPAGYTVPEVERILGISKKSGYKLIKAGKLAPYVDCVGQLRVPVEEVYSYLKRKED